MATQKFISYLRVSTKRQGQSGLGIEAQRDAVADYLAGVRARLVAEYVEHESGTRSDRPELGRAFAACRAHRATLVVAKLDRLSRNAAFLLTLRNSGVRFVAADMPEANELTVGVLALVAEYEARAISERTKAALAAARKRGVKLGTPNLSSEARASGSRASARVRLRLAQQRAGDLTPILDELRESGLTSLRDLARALNERGIEAPRGGDWSATTVSRLLTRTRSLDAPRGTLGEEVAKLSALS
jgi:DNA invertase Pin-like site-specific DNA recombinase